VELQFFSPHMDSWPGQDVFLLLTENSNLFAPGNLEVGDNGSFVQFLVIRKISVFRIVVKQDKIDRM
jgi:hypothetical protein